MGNGSTFIIAASCKDAYAALRDVIPKYTFGERVEVISQTEDTLTVDYTEGAFGLNHISTSVDISTVSNSPNTHRYLLKWLRFSILKFKFHLSNRMTIAN